MDVPPFLKKRVLGLPLGVWVVAIAGAAGVGLYLRSRSSGDAEDEADQTDSMYGDAVNEDPYGVVPSSSLPSEDAGYWPITGGGPPGYDPMFPPEPQAITLDPGTLRIKLIQRKKHHHGQDKDHGGRHPNNPHRHHHPRRNRPRRRNRR